MNEQLKELLPNPTFVDYQVLHAGQGADFYDEQRMLEYGRRIVRECCFTGEQYAEGLIDPSHYAFINKKVKEHFGIKE